MSSVRTALLAIVSWAATACSTEPPAPLPLSVAPLDRTGASPVYDLARIDGTYALPMSNQPGGVRFSADMELTGGAIDNDGVVQLALPFQPSAAANRFAPRGMSVEIDGETIPYRADRLPKGRTGWTIAKGELRVRPPEGWTAGPIVVHHPELARRVSALDLEGAEGPTADHVRRSLTLDDETRSGLMIAAPGTGSWTLTLPAGGRLVTALGMIPAPLPDAESDGALAIVTVVAGGERHEVARQPVPPRPVEFDPLEVDLSSWAGQEITLELSADPVNTPDYDYVFFASPTVSGTPTGDVRRVVVIGVDTLRASHLSLYGYDRPTSPELDAWAERAVVFDEAWTPAPRTRPSFRTATTGRRPLDAIGATNIGEVFDRNGFATAAFVANVHLHPRFGFDDGFDLWHLDTKAKADDQVDSALAWLEQNKDRDSYLFLHIMDPHLFYVAPRRYASSFITDPDPDLPSRFGRGDVYRWMRKGEIDDRRKEHIKALYDAEIAYTSAQLGRFLQELDALGGTTMVVVHNDHGEEFWEHEAFEHNHSVYDEVVKAAMIVRPPGGKGARSDVPATLADIAPTLYDYAGFTDLPPSDGVSLRPAIEGPLAATDDAYDRPLPVGYLRYGHERWAVVWRGHKYVLHTHSGIENLYDLTEDPGETTNVADTADLEPYRRALALAHGVPVGPGWQIQAVLHGDVPIELKLPRPALSAGVIDPESLVETPVNQAWGEVPPVLPTDVATVELSEDGLKMTITPGPHGRGTLYVLFDQPTAPEALAWLGDAEPTPFKERPMGLAHWGEAGQNLIVRSATVIVPVAGEAERMRSAAAGVDATGAELELLQALGYVEDDH